MKILQAPRGVFSGLVSLSLMVVCNLSYAVPFEIRPYVTLPTKVHPGAKVYAYYRVTNLTNRTFENAYVKSLPPGVKQVTRNGAYPNTCATQFSLGPKGSINQSCILQLVIDGPVISNPKDPNKLLFVCLAGATTCVGTRYPLNVAVGAWGWQRNAVEGQAVPTYIADIATLGSQIFAGGVENLQTEKIHYMGGELWRRVSEQPSSWAEQYQDAIPFSKVSSLISNADETGLFSSTGNNGFGGVDQYTPGAKAPVPVGNIGQFASAVNDLELGDSNILFAAGAKGSVPRVAEVWRYDGQNWNPTHLAAQALGPAFWLTYASPSSPTPGLFVAAEVGFSSKPVIYKYDGHIWQDTRLPTRNMTLLQAMNTDATDSLYAVGSVSNGVMERGSILKYAGAATTGGWQTIPAPKDSRALSMIVFSVPANFMYVGGLDKHGEGAVWYTHDAGKTWTNTDLKRAASVTALTYAGGQLIAAGSLAGTYGAAIWSMEAQ